MNRVFGAGLSAFKGGQRGHHLEGGAGGVDSLHRLVGQGAVFVLQQRLVIGHRDAADEEIAVKAGGRDGGQYVTAVAIEHDGRGAFALEARVDVGLQMAVGGDLDVLARLSFAAVQFAHDAACCVLLDPLGAGCAAKHILAPRFKADLADLEPRDQQELVGRVDLFQILFADRADIAQNMRVFLLHRIAPGQADLGAYAGQGRGVDGNAAQLRPADPVRDGDGMNARAAHFLARALQLFGVQFNQLAQPREGILDITRLLPLKDNAVARHVFGNDQAVAIKYLSARRRDQTDLDPVLVGQKAKLVRLIHLKMAHPPCQQPHEPRLARAQHQAAPRNAFLAAHTVLGCPFHEPNLLAPVVDAPGLDLRTPVNRADTNTTTG